MLLLLTHILHITTSTKKEKQKRRRPGIGKIVAEMIQSQIEKYLRYFQGVTKRLFFYVLIHVYDYRLRLQLLSLDQSESFYVIFGVWIIVRRLGTIVFFFLHIQFVDYLVIGYYTYFKRSALNLKFESTEI